MIGRDLSACHPAKEPENRLSSLSDYNPYESCNSKAAIAAGQSMEVNDGLRTIES